MFCGNKSGFYDEGMRRSHVELPKDLIVADLKPFVDVEVLKTAKSEDSFAVKCFELLLWKMDILFEFLFFLFFQRLNTFWTFLSF